MPATLHGVTAASQLPGPCHLLVAGKDCGSVAEAAAKIQGIEKVLRVEHDAYADPVAEDLAPLLVAMAAPYDYLVAASTTFSRNVMPGSRRCSIPPSSATSSRWSHPRPSSATSMPATR
jgi:electron transfer flavoprotein alpha subunit